MPVNLGGVTLAVCSWMSALDAVDGSSARQVSAMDLGTPQAYLHLADVQIRAFHVRLQRENGHGQKGSVGIENLNWDSGKRGY